MSRAKAAPPPPASPEDAAPPKTERTRTPRMKAASEYAKALDRRDRAAAALAKARDRVTALEREWDEATEAAKDAKEAMESNAAE